ncbi:MAG: sulfatase-like hydrolase/transferase [Deltaproteobacteria bacterium]|nr:sulfatase-like hydrolase/transferase [Deltaproteobacteria bacterium]
MTYPNIILITVDALRADRMGFQGYEMNTTPILDSIVRKSIWCDNAFSLVGTTQPSFATIFTSTRPLSYGGYDRGIANRPNSLPEVLQKVGYETVHLLTFAWMRSTYGYDRGVEYQEHLYSIKDIIGGALLTIKSTVGAYSDGVIPFDEMMETVQPAVRTCLEDILKCCNERMAQSEIETKYFRHALFVCENYNFSKIKALTQIHINEFDKSPGDYINKHILGLSNLSSNAWMSSYFRFKRSPGKLMSMCWDFALKLVSFVTRNRNIRLREIRHKGYADSGDLTDRIISILNERRSRPLFLSTHFLDTHIPYVSGRLPEWHKKVPKYLHEVGHPYDVKLSLLTISSPTTDEEIVAWRRFYDASVRYTDEQLGRLIEALDKTEQGRNTVVIIAGDHGEEIGEHGDFSHRFRLYEESIHVPIICYHADLKETRVDALVDLRDLAPTILDIAGLPIPETYEGKPVTKIGEDEREYIIFESFYRGNCLFSHRPLYMGIRTKRYKYIWREWIDPLDKVSKDRVELYDLEIDKDEKTNIYSSDSPMVEYFNMIIANRLKEIPEISSNRAMTSLNDLGV